ncbi:hypothetical protein ACF0H5_023709 [Mactra antiquata]
MFRSKGSKVKSSPDKKTNTNRDAFIDNNDGSTYIHGREHIKVVDDKKGKETFLYQPSSNYNESLSPEMENFYRKLDTTTKFEIRRPKVSMNIYQN